MLKNILNFEGAQQLTNNEQKSINGGLIYACNVDSDCKRIPPVGTRYVCIHGACKLEIIDL